MRNIGILPGRNLDADSPPLLALKERARVLGISSVILSDVSDGYDLIVCIGKENDISTRVLRGVEPPGKPEGYLIRFVDHEGKRLAVLKGHDKLGEMWAVASFNQLYDYNGGTPRILNASVDDYPVHKHRGVFLNEAGVYRNPEYFTPLKVATFFTQFKMSWVYFYDRLNGQRSREAWRKPIDKSWISQFTEVSRWLTPLGIRWTVAFNPLLHRPMRTSVEEDRNHFLPYADTLYSLGGELSIHFDDFRIPLPVEDEKRFGSAREADLSYIHHLYGYILERHGPRPLIFCPPFYFGPAGRAPYAEDRDRYLFELGNRLPPQVEVIWTGTRVKFRPILKSDMEWITSRLKRKPLLSANIPGEHKHLYYLGDTISKTQRLGYDGLFEDLSGYLWNSNDLIVTLTILDYMWNPEAYDPSLSPKKAAQLLIGPKAYSSLLASFDALRTLDVYAKRTSPAAVRDVSFIHEEIQKARHHYEEARALYPEVIDLFSNAGSVIAGFEQYVTRLRSTPGLGKEEEKGGKAAIEDARREVQYVEEEDVFIQPYDFLGGATVSIYGVRCPPRLATWVYGANTAYPLMKAPFECDPFPPEGDYEMFLSAQDGGTGKEKCKIRISVNGHTVFEGASGFKKGGWSRARYTVPANVLMRNNVVSIENLEPSGYTGEPFFMLNYLVIKRHVTR